MMSDLFVLTYLLLGFYATRARVGFLASPRRSRVHLSKITCSSDHKAWRIELDVGESERADCPFPAPF